MKTETVKQAIQNAAELAESAPDSFKKEAFQVILTTLLNNLDIDNKQEQKVVSVRKPAANKTYENRELMLKDILGTNIDFSAYDTIIESGTWVDKSLMILKVVEDEFGIGGLTVNELASIMKDKLRLSSVYTSNISRDLAEANQLALRNKEGKGKRFIYSLSRNGDDYLKKFMAKKN